MNRKEAVNVIKRFLLAFLICVPIFVVIGIFLQGKIANIWIIIMYVVIGGAGFVLEEIIHTKIEEKRELKREKYKLAKKYSGKNSAIENAINSKEKEDNTKSDTKENK